MTGAESIWSALVAIVVPILFVALLAAPLKLYAIHQELRKQNEELRTHTKLLASIANSLAEKGS